MTQPPHCHLLAEDFSPHPDKHTALKDIQMATCM